MRRIVLAFAVLCLFSSVASAQITGLVPNPTVMDFTASPDHAAVNQLTGAPLVSDYKAYYFLNTVATPAKGLESLIVPLGKPTPDGTGKITVTNIFGGILPNTAYKAIVVANGPGGESAISNVSVPFGNPVLVVPSKVPGTPLPR